MSLGWDVAAALPAFRAQAESVMQSRCTVRRLEGLVWDEETMTDAPNWVEVWSGPCKIKFRSTMTREIDAQTQLLTEQEPELSVPVAGTGGIRINDVATIDVNPHDPETVGTQLRIAGLHVHTFATARRFQTEVTG